MSRPAADFDVVAVGSWTNFDHLFEVTSLPAPGDTVQICSPVDDVERVYFGGCAPNVAVAAARLGARSALVSVVGEDFNSRGYAAHLDECGVDRRAVQIIARERCGHSFVFRDADGDSVCISQIGVAARQEEFAPDPAALAAARVAVITYRFDRFTLKAAELARAGGAQVILSGALATAPDLDAAFVGRANMLVCTEHELAQLVSSLALDDARALLETGLSAIVCTRGAAGIAWQGSGKRGQVPAVAACRVLDSTGAGDGFVAGLAVGLARGQALPDAIRLGASVASFVVEALGCQTNLPSLPAAQARLARV
ncbi:MAG: carbohydrate kinase family protein [Anaerolineaceae bacterium]|nr:carbohydrate kinase family protein [Anaerolineaceae bacterium]MDE0328461.1 carbohydrate kinase family protein [Anaerolineaceae bacterium]